MTDILGNTHIRSHCHPRSLTLTYAALTCYLTNKDMVYIKIKLDVGRPGRKHQLHLQSGNADFFY